ncbi:MAG TPA: hypothetical protein VE713_12240 [Pyrinomonadaceae bacterium]|nr:hypothetical protein [Pyrinomonadaceae bacterium]
MSRQTKRQRIVERVVARMQTISIENGFQTDAGQLVKKWAARLDDKTIEASPAKCQLSVCDLLDEVSKESKQSKGATHRLRVQVRIFKAKGNADDDLRTIIGDVVDAVGRDVAQNEWPAILWPDETGKPLAMDTEPSSEGFVIPTEAMEISGGAVEFTIVYATAVFDPYQ